MANLTVDDAITEIRQELDDTSTTRLRWTADQIKAKLKTALSQCLTKYADEGGDRFDLESAAFTTSASTGQVAITSITPLWVKQVAIVVDSVAYRLPRAGPIRRGRADLNARALRILYVQEYVISSTTTHPLVGDGAAAANSWPAFDRWVYMEAASQLAGKDMEIKRIEMLREKRDEAKAAALSRPSTPGGYPIPRPEWSPVAQRDLRWQFTQTGSASTLSLTSGW